MLDRRPRRRRPPNRRRERLGRSPRRATANVRHRADATVSGMRPGCRQRRAVPRGRLLRACGERNGAESRPNARPSSTGARRTTAPSARCAGSTRPRAPRDRSPRQAHPADAGADEAGHAGRPAWRRRGSRAGPRRRRPPRGGPARTGPCARPPHRGEAQARTRGRRWRRPHARRRRPRPRARRPRRVHRVRRSSGQRERVDEAEPEARPGVHPPRSCGDRASVRPKRSTAPATFPPPRSSAATCSSTPGSATAKCRSRRACPIRSATGPATTAASRRDAGAGTPADASATTTCRGVEPQSHRRLGIGAEIGVGAARQRHPETRREPPRVAPGMRRTWQPASARRAAATRARTPTAPTIARSEVNAGTNSVDRRGVGSATPLDRGAPTAASRFAGEEGPHALGARRRTSAIASTRRAPPG